MAIIERVEQNLLGIDENIQKKRHWGIFGKRDCRYCAFYKVEQTSPKQMLEDQDGNKSIESAQYTSMCTFNAVMKGRQVHTNTGDMQQALQEIVKPYHYERLETTEACPEFKPNRWQRPERLLRGYW